jgi:hypothetical protein
MGEVAQEGMSLRDYFAAAALPGSFALILAEVEAGTRATNLTPGEQLVKMAYEAADAMLAERSKP